MKRTIVDLSFSIHEGMTTFPSHWHPMVEISILGRHGIENRASRKIVMGTHTGTHCDAPLHFIPDGESIDNLSLDTLVGPAKVLDLSDSKEGQTIGVEELKRAMGEDKPERIVLRFDWSEKWGKIKYYQDYPFLSEDAAEWLVQRGVRLIATDTPSLDNPAHGWGSKIDCPNHKILLGRGVILVEYLCNLKKLKTQSIDLIVMPLKITGADGAPARCAAIEQ